MWCSALTEVSEQRRQVQLLMAEGLQGKHDYAALLKLSNAFFAASFFLVFSSAVGVLTAGGGIDHPEGGSKWVF